MSKPLRVLFVEDSEQDAALLRELLIRGGYSLSECRVEDDAAMRQALLLEQWDIVISDYTMPRFDALQALSLAREIKGDIPFIIVSGSIGEDRAVDAMRAGAQDYIMKDKLSRLLPVIDRELKEAVERKARREAEEQLKAGERTRALGEAAASVLHDLKNPLQVMMSCIEAIETLQLTEEKRARFFAMLSQQVDRMEAMTKEVLEFTRGEIKLAPRAENLSTLMRQVVDSFSVLTEQKSVTLKYTEDLSDGATWSFAIDRERIIRGIVNLLDNARCATPSGGIIHLRLAASQSAATLRVEDTGPGIADEIVGKLFDPFVTHGKPQGTGLGLCITKRIIEGHGGTIGVESYRNAGTRFTIVLPRVDVKQILTTLSQEQTPALAH